MHSMHPSWCNVQRQPSYASPCERESLRFGESKSWTQVETAVYLGISRNHLSGLERGKREIGLLMLQVIAKGLDTTMDKLLKGL